MDKRINFATGFWDFIDKHPVISFVCFFILCEAISDIGTTTIYKGTREED